MLADTYTLGTSGDALTFAKRFPDNNKSVFSVAGLPASMARTFTVSHQPTSSGRNRTLVRLDEVDAIPGDSQGRTSQSSLYIVLERSSFKSQTDCLAMFKRLKTLVDDQTFQSKILNLEV